MRRRTRSVQILAGATTLVVVGMAGVFLPGTRMVGRMAYAQTKGAPEAPPGIPVEVPARQEEVLPPISPQPVADPGPENDPDPFRSPKSAKAITNVAPPSLIASDPEKSAENLIARTRKEAEDSVEALNKEAAALRDRLARVEAGLARYQATLDALSPERLGKAVAVPVEGPSLRPNPPTQPAELSTLPVAPMPADPPPNFPLPEVVPPPTNFPLPEVVPPPSR